MKVTIFIVLTIVYSIIEYGSADNMEIDEKYTQISKSIECSDDVKRFCKDEKYDMSILNCFQDSKEVMSKISKNCQHFLWDYKYKLTTSDSFDNIVKSQCSKEFNSLTLCKEASPGHRVSCLIDHKDMITRATCSRFLEEIAVIVFSDYHLIYKFIDHCSEDIKKLSCGRIGKLSSNGDGDDNSVKSLEESGITFLDSVTSQSHTLDCLADNVAVLDKDCKHQMMRLHELQSNDYHLNRGLYYACRDDRETLCHDVRSGEGRVYECLLREKFNDKMSTYCRSQLIRKQKVESVDANANYQLMHSCARDIRDNKCMTDSPDSSHEIVAMAEMLTCLQNAEIIGNALEPNCRAVIAEIRKEMFDDLQISPELLMLCKNEVELNCKANISEPGGLVHCLMKLAEPDQRHKQGQLSNRCQGALVTLLKVSNPTDDVMSVDDEIGQACKSSYMALCQSHTNMKDAFQCLVENINSPKISNECREKISSLAYFMSLDIRIDNKLNAACHKDAVRLCKGPSTVEQTLKRTPMEASAEYYCMYQFYKKDRITMDLAEAKGLPLSPKDILLSAKCALEIFNLIKIQASKVEFDPKVYLPCFDDIGRFCGDQKHRGQEYQCLQTNVKMLEPKCRDAIIEFSEMEDIDFRLNRMASEACAPMVKLFCSHEKEEQVMQCLEEHKVDSQMTDSCYAAIEHFQIMSLEEFHIDHQFASFCGPEIDKYCRAELSKAKNSKNKAVATKASIVSCLSKTVTAKLLNGEEHPLSQECRRQFTFELLQRSESLKLDPYLVEDCGEDIKKMCDKVEKSQISFCLRSNQDNLSHKCHQRLFKRERLEALDAHFDGELQLKCSQMIDEHCHGIPGRKLFQCLHRLMNERGFDKQCKILILSRLERRMNDIRLNPGLIRACREEIKKYCQVDNPNVDEPTNGIEYEGKVIHCLKVQFTNHTATFNEGCRQRVMQIIVEANTNLRLDPTLRRSCSSDINEFCKKELSAQYVDPIHSVHNCLKHKFLLNDLRSNDCKNEIKRLLREGRADVHVDIELFDACENTIMKLCRSESFGYGRKLACLLSLVSDEKASVMIESRCLKLISERREMWAMVTDIETQSLQELLGHVTSSSTRVYLISMLALIVAALLLLGICCGRVSKKVMVDHKNK